MSLEVGALVGMAIGMIGMVALGGFAIWSKIQEDKEKKARSCCDH